MVAWQELAALGFDKHHNKPPEYRSWSAARERCRSPKCKDYPGYGGRGIVFDERWDDFDVFLADMGRRPDGHTLERKDNDGPYSPENCKWATHKEQARNRSNASDLNAVLNGSLVDAAAAAGLPYGALCQRLRRGWSVEKALSVPAVKPRTHVEWNGKRMRLSEAVKISGLPSAVVHHRLSRNWTVEAALSQPKGNYRGCS